MPDLEAELREARRGRLVAELRRAETLHEQCQNTLHGGPWPPHTEQNLEVQAREAKEVELALRVELAQMDADGPPTRNSKGTTELRKLINVVRDAHRDVLRVSDAVARLPITDATAREWLQRAGLVRDLEGREIVIWGEVLTRLRAPEALKPKRLGAKATRSLPRVSLD